MKSKVLLFIALLFLPIWGGMKAEINVSSAQAIFIYNFLLNIEWPENSIGSSYTIGVVGRTETTNSLKSFTANRKIGSRPIEVVQFQSAQAIRNCQILLVARNSSKEMELIKQKTESSACLIIGEKPGLTEVGATIAFDIEGGKLRFTIDQANAIQHQLSVSSKLIQMSK